MTAGAGQRGLRSQRSERSERSSKPRLPRVVPFGEAALLVEFARRPALDPNRRVHALAEALLAEPPPGLRSVVPGSVSLLVEFDPLLADGALLERRLAERLAQTQRDAARPPRRERVIPTVYGGEFGPDLEAVARAARLTPDEVVRLHTATPVQVYLIGFSPGYPYMGDLPPALALPRRDTPREQVPPGSVAIADGQTGIYTRPTPGGWHLIGRTPLVLFDERREPPAYLAPGDRVRHIAVPASDWDRLAGPAADW